MAHSHSHGGHHHQHDNAYLTGMDKRDPGVRITRIGLYVNLGMAVAKGAGGYIFNSQALTADAWHSLTDLVSDVMTLLTISYSLRPASTKFPLGYGKIESLGALAVSSLLLLGGIAIGAQAVLALAHQFFPDFAHMLPLLSLLEHSHSHGHSHGAAEVGPSIHAAWLAGGSIIVKEILYRATMKVAKQKRSSVLASNAYHHRVDSLTAFVALFTICASHFITEAHWLDPVGGLVISGMIIQAGFSNLRSACLEVADVGLDGDIQSSIEEAAAAALQEQVAASAEIRGVQGIKSGQNILVEIEVGIPVEWPVSKVNELEKSVRSKIAAEVRGVRRVTLRFKDIASKDKAFENDFVAPKREVETEKSHTHDHHHDHHHDRDDHHQHTNGDAHAGTMEQHSNGSATKRK